jgi:type II secretory pathway pseudopilin PulG
MVRSHIGRSGDVAGFSLIEVAVTLTTLSIAAGMGMPALLNYMQRAKLEGAAHQVEMMLYSTRLEAITRGAPTVVMIDESTGDLVSFADVNGAGANPTPDGIFDPIAGEPYKQTDYELGRLRFAVGVKLADPRGDEGLDSVDGFVNPAPIPARLAYFNIDGTVRDDGAFRLADERGNFLEARIAATTTARVELRKWDGAHWREQGEGEAGAWSWR